MGGPDGKRTNAPDPLAVNGLGVAGYGPSRLKKSRTVPSLLSTILCLCDNFKWVEPVKLRPGMEGRLSGLVTCAQPAVPTWSRPSWYLMSMKTHIFEMFSVSFVKIFPTCCVVCNAVFISIKKTNRDNDSAFERLVWTIGILITFWPYLSVGQLRVVFVIKFSFIP